ncbi:CoA transferase [Frankia sp. CNm7]|uniref:CoA transferase n=1 Tax=Frankia nepalensis TaxID=1836974 RepID=A0A937RKS6_9ACTN|nr:CoA transferase [Frankia nepalensis]MBL7499157.1 CoA transferase [Frankia nepalensis]MBL7511025.1 CoA transferase [Frankia nepalensis]MBL7520507.1 CoA transferase [Frankia nepalensis]MBL7632105.1 CoA transferase [Frankia nepalensis]
MNTSRTRSPLADLKVLELASGTAGPMAGMMFADYGAEVVKVEPPTGDWARGTRGFQMWNRGKRSVVLDLASSAADREALRALVRRSDVVLTNYRPGVAEQLGVGEAEVRRLNPTAVCCAISGFGPLVECAGLRAYEGIVAAKAGKMVGLDALSGAAPDFAGGRPIYSAAPVAGFAAGQLAFQGIVAALLERARTGRGRYVETSLLQGAITATMRQDLRRAELEGPVNGRAAASGAPGGPSVQLRGIALTFLTARCADGGWIQMCARQDHHFRSWMRALGLDWVLTDPRYVDGPLAFRTLRDIEDLERVIRKRMSECTQAEWMSLFIEHDVGSDPFLDFDGFLAHPQLTANERVVEVADRELGPVRQLGPLVNVNGAGVGVERGAPLLGEHTAEVLDEARAVRGAGGDQVAGQPQIPAERTGGPLAGIVVVELATYLAGPLGGTLLAEMGARVIKVEPMEGDAFRRLGLQFVHLQHGKESIALNLKSSGGKEVLRRLVREADVFFHNFRGGPVERLGCDFVSISAINPRIVYVNAAAYGSRGPEANRTAFHSTPNALSGGGILQAGRGNVPVDDSYPDPCSGIAVASAILLGLFGRGRSGRAQHLETTMLASTGYVHSSDLVSYEGAPSRLEVDPEQQGLHALYRLYECSSGWLFAAVVGDAEWRRFARALGHGEWCEDPRFADAAARLSADADLAALVAPVLQERTAKEWAAALAAVDVAAVQADERGFEEFLIHSGLVSADEHPEHGKYWRLPPRVTFDGVGPDRRPATALGESTVAVLEELGYGPQEIAALCAERAVLADGPKARG